MNHWGKIRKNSGWKTLFTNLKKKKAEKRRHPMGINRPLNLLQCHPPSPPPIRMCKRGLGIFRDQSYTIIDKEIVLRSLTAFARKIDLKISLKGALWSDSLPNSSRKINEVNAPCILKEIIKRFYLVPNHQVISVETLSYQLSWILFCNRYRFALYRAQRKSKHAFHFPLGSQLVKPVRNTTQVL